MSTVSFGGLLSETVDTEHAAVNSEQTRAGVSRPVHGQVSVKNTFIHYDDDDEQPDYRPTKSGPAFAGNLGANPAFVQLDSSLGAFAGRGAASNFGGAGNAVAAVAPLSVTADMQLSSPTGGVSVKNTFIHLDLDEQPDHRLTKSPGTSPDRIARLDPAFVQFPSTPESPLAPAPTIPAPFHAEAHARFQDSHSQGSLRHQLDAAGLGVKNTFLHYSVDDGEQPDYKPAKSGPAKLFGMEAAEPAWVPLPASGLPPPAQAPALPSGAVPVVEAARFQAAPTASVGSADPMAPTEAPMTSLGSAGHALGNCKACAHAWKPGGCAKGAECTFCHLCDEEDFKQRRRDKLSRLKAEKVRRRGEGDVEGEAERGPASAAASGQGACDVPAPGASACGSTNGPTAEGEPSVGELVVGYEGTCARIQWAMDARRLRSQSRGGLSRRFTVQLLGREVPFVFFVTSAADGAEAPRGRGMDLALQLKCVDAAGLSGTRFSVRFTVGSHIPPRVASDDHDFASAPFCSLSAQDSLWDLGPAPKCIMRAEVRPNSLKF
mmetsp:Transcript_72772/g.236353  ORF Transcript_72772/g.236353 Transcript_72772/m.236353 type:complete len:547 (-) Transcript_72772:50-1690(-)